MPERSCAGRCRQLRVLRGQRSWPRRAKYLLLTLERGTLILHLGMSGSLRVLRQPRRRGSSTISSTCTRLGAGRCASTIRAASAACTTRSEDPAQHRLLRSLAPEPFDEAFDAAYSAAHHARGARRHQAGADERPRWSPASATSTPARRCSAPASTRAARAAPDAQGMRAPGALRCARRCKPAIRAGGTTLRDYVGTDGNPGEFRQKLYVYERDGQPCRVCGTPIRQITQGQRSSYFCPQCQRLSPEC